MRNTRGKVQRCESIFNVNNATSAFAAAEEEHPLRVDFRHFRFIRASRDWTFWILRRAMLQFCAGKVLLQLVLCRKRTDVSEAKQALWWSRLFGAFGYVDAFGLGGCSQKLVSCNVHLTTRKSARKLEERKSRYTLSHRIFPHWFFS